MGHHHHHHHHHPIFFADRRGAADDPTTSFLHSSRFSESLRASLSCRPVHSRMLSSHLFFCPPLLLPPCTVPWRTVLASPVDRVMCPYHFSLRFLTVVRRQSLMHGIKSDQNT